MTREIRFRGKTKGTQKCVNGLWVYGYLFKYVDGKTFILYDLPGAFGNERLQKIEVIPETVGQYTGKYDKNGKEIYSNDYVRWFGASGVEDAVGVVKWDNDKSAYVVYVDDYNEHYLYDVYYADMVVIGNIHEKGGKQ